MSKKVSVIIPTYNRVTLFRAVASALQSTLPVEDVEVIVVDDASKDGSFELFKKIDGKFGDSLRLIQQESNQGPGACRNRALECAQGEYLFFLDSDDLLAHDALHDLLTFASATDSDVVLGNKRLFDGRMHGGASAGKTKVNADLVRDQVLATLGPVSKLIKTSLVKKYDLKFDEGVWWGEDQPFVLAVYLLANKVSVLADRTYVYIGHDGLNLTFSSGSLDNRLSTIVKLFRVIDSCTGGMQSDKIFLLKAMVTNHNLATFVSQVESGQIVVEHDDFELLDVFKRNYLTREIDLHLPVNLSDWLNRIPQP